MQRNIIYRSVPLSVTLGNLFGGFMNQFGWLFFSFGMIFVWVFVPDIDFSFIHFWGKNSTVEGYIIRIEDTNVAINEMPVINHYYSFKAPDGNVYLDNSFATGKEYPVDTKVSIEYPKGKPEISRIVGTRRGKAGIWLLFVCIFPAIGLIFIFLGLQLGRKMNRLLKSGRLTTGKLKSKTATNMRVNKQRVFHLTFAFLDSDNQEHLTSTKTHLPSRLEDDAEERILYNPANPKQAILVDIIPGMPKIQSNFVLPVSLQKSILVSTIPVLSILIHGFILLEMLL